MDRTDAKTLPLAAAEDMPSFGLARFTGDVGLAEELAQDALVVALERWPISGIPLIRAAG